ncbi:MFS transporter [Williamsia limnetica]|uniref:MFS transporter n=1 Tax=Williamsia limnetica TaxID=882452 RepID=A0A318RMT5_WILLI|nr:MFS transporter [Williamsia limnetica]PYE17874.1 MFS transporter [Williamsia limnetica]
MVLSARFFPGSKTIAKLRVAPPVVRLLLVSMVLFNIGFYLVVPFLAVHLSQDLGFAAWIVGLVLGLRMFSQQGMFFLGGSLADKFGTRPVILVGIAIRVAGFLLLGLAQSVALVIAGILLVGFAAALFAPAVESANAVYGRGLEEAGVMRRTELFALEQMCSRLGTVIGPALGAALLVVPFSWTASAAAVLFAVLWVGFYRYFERPTGGIDGRLPDVPAVTHSLRTVWRSVLSNRPFLLFAALCSVQLAAYSQLYLMLPEQLDRGIGSQSSLGWFYVGGAVLVIVGQGPTVSVAHRLGHRRAITIGLLLIAASFLAPLATGVIAPASYSTQIVGLAMWIAVLHLGQMLMVPPMRDTIAILGRENNLGAHYGMLNTIGGTLALLGTVTVGGVYDLVDNGHAVPATPWLLVATGVAASAAGLWVWSGRSSVIAAHPRH